MNLLSKKKGVLADKLNLNGLVSAIQRERFVSVAEEVTTKGKGSAIMFYFLL